MKILNSPIKVLFICIGFFLFSLIANGTFFQLYRLNKDSETLAQQINDSKKEIKDIQKNILLTRDPSYYEKQALDNLDLATEDDLIFVFSAEDPT